MTDDFAAWLDGTSFSRATTTTNGKTISTTTGARNPTAAAAG